jgi:hypothetical protein
MNRFYPGTARRPVSGKKSADRGSGVSAPQGRDHFLPVTGRRPVSIYAAHEPLRYRVSATSTFALNACAMDSQFFSQRNNVFHEYKCLRL